MTQEIRGVEQLLDVAVAITNERDYSRIPEVFTESFLGHGPSGMEDIDGPEGFEAWLREFTAAFPDMEFVVEDELLGDDLVMIEWTMTGTHKEEFNGLPPTHNEFALHGMSKFVIEDQKIDEEFMYFDRQGFFDQLGL